MKKLLVTISLTLLLLPLYAQRPGALGNGAYVWRSALLPGWGQFHNKNAGAGLFFSLGVAAGIGGVVFTEAERSKNIRLRDETSLTNRKRVYSDRAAQWQTTRNIIGIAALAVYAGNIIHAASTKSNLYAYNPRRVKFFARATPLSSEVGLCFSLGRADPKHRR